LGSKKKYHSLGSKKKYPNYRYKCLPLIWIFFFWSHGVMLSIGQCDVKKTLILPIKK
jgi:hypothetical protein